MLTLSIRRWWLFPVVLAWGLAGCAGGPPPTASPTAGAAKPPVDPAANADYQRALWALKAGRRDEATTLFKAMTAKYPTLAGPFANLGILYRDAGKLNDAEPALTQAAKLDPKNAAIQNQLGILYRQLGQFTQARDAYLQALKIDPNYAYAHLNLGILYDIYLAELNQALKEYEAYQGLSGGKDELVTKWIADVKQRLGTADKNRKPGGPA